MNVLSLFDGMSCGQIALKNLGIKVDNYYSSEIDKYAQLVTRKNFPNTIFLGDVTKIDLDSLPKIDLLIGGSPCQGFSFGGKGLNFSDPRSKLFFEFIKIKNKLNPKYFLLENVRMKKEWKDIISKHMGVDPIAIDSKFFSAQKRFRYYWTNIDVEEWSDENISLSDILEKNPDIKYNLSQKAVARVNRSKFGQDFFTRKSDKVGTLIAGYYKIPTDGIYLKESSSRHRRFTPLECERLQTVSDDYTKYGVCSSKKTVNISNTQRWKMLGNGWTVSVISHILKGINKKSNEEYLEEEYIWKIFGDI